RQAARHRAQERQKLRAEAREVSGPARAPADPRALARRRRPGGLFQGKECGMKWRRFALAGFLVLGLALGGTAGDGNAKKIVGLWEFVKSDEEGKGPPPGTTVRFTKDGKLKLHLKVEDKEFNLEGTYKVDGKKLTINIEFGGKSKEDIATI